MYGYHPPWIPDMGLPHSPLRLTSGGQHWRLVQTCSLEDLPSPTGTDIQWWPPKCVQLASGQYTCYWNAVLLGVPSPKYLISTIDTHSFSKRGPAYRHICLRGQHHHIISYHHMNIISYQYHLSLFRNNTSVCCLSLLHSIT